MDNTVVIFLEIYTVYRHDRKSTKKFGFTLSRVLISTNQYNNLTLYHGNCTRNITIIRSIC